MSSRKKKDVNYFTIESQPGLFLHFSSHTPPAFVQLIAILSKIFPSLSVFTAWVPQAAGDLFLSLQRSVVAFPFFSLLFPSQIVSRTILFYRRTSCSFSSNNICNWRLPGAMNWLMDISAPLFRWSRKQRHCAACSILL